MALLVQKFGGTSVGGLDRIDGVAARVAASIAEGHQVVVVVSAMAGQTDSLLNLARAISSHGRPNPRELDALLATGEQVSAALLCMALEKVGYTARSFTGWQAGIKTDNLHGRASIDTIDTGSLTATLERGRIPVVAGFQGVGGENSITTLGRGGSDTTAVMLAAALGADECQIFTDVDGVYRADPRVVEHAECLAEIEMAEMECLAAAGSKVLQVDSVRVAKEQAVALRVLSTFETDKPGTRVCADADLPVSGSGVTGIACRRHLATLGISLEGGDDLGSLLDKLTEASRLGGIDLALVRREVAEAGSMNFTFIVAEGDHDLAHEIMQPLILERSGKLHIEQGVAEISMVGAAIPDHASCLEAAMACLEQAGISSKAARKNELSCSLIVTDAQANDAVRHLYREFMID
ncbi:MAG: aspartate kinase [Gammaproteobacteria bacterium]|nr:aspartate kinase [Gammaproteobacteria bacterium]